MKKIAIKQVMVYSISLRLTATDGLIFIVCDEIPDLFIALTADSDIRTVITRVLTRCIGDNDNDDVEIYIENPILDYEIRVLVKAY